MGGEDRIGGKRRSGNSNAPCTISRIGGSTRQNSRIRKLCPWCLDGSPSEATGIRGRDRSLFCERATAYSRDELLEVREGCRQSLGILGSCFEDGLAVDRRVHKSPYLSSGNAQLPGRTTTSRGDTNLLIGKTNANRNAHSDELHSIINYHGDIEGHEGRFRGQN